MFTALKKLTRSNDDRCPAPMPMSSSFQKKFSRGVHFNMKILIKGDRNVGKSCLLQRLQGGQFIEEYVPTDQIQVAPIHWTYKNSDYIVKVEVWEVVDKGRTKKKPPLGLKLDNQSAVPVSEDEAPVLDATFLDVYKNASGVILMFDITKPWTFEYVVKELSQVPADLPIVVLGNHCDMQHHRQVHPHHIDQALHPAKLTRTAPVRYAESSMRNGFGLRLLHKFLSVPFLRLQKTSLLEQLQRNQRDMEETENDLDDFQNSEESHYNSFVDRLANKRKQSATQPENRTGSDRSPSIVLGAGKPIIPPNVNPLLAQSLNQPAKSQTPEVSQTQYVNTELLKRNHPVSVEMTPPRLIVSESHISTPPAATAAAAATAATASSGTLDEFYAGTLDSSFLEDLSPLTTNANEVLYESESDDDVNTTNPRVNIDQDDLEVDTTLNTAGATYEKSISADIGSATDGGDAVDKFIRLSVRRESDELAAADTDSINVFVHGNSNVQLAMDNDFPIWATDSSTRRSPEGGEDPDVVSQDVGQEKADKKHKKKKSKEKEKEDYSDRSDRKEKKHKHKKVKSEKRVRNTQQDLLAAPPGADLNHLEYDSI